MPLESYEHPRTSGWPWWMDPYSDNPVAFGVLFLLILAAMIGGLLLFRFLFVHSPGASPISPPSMLLYRASTAFALLLGR